MKSRDLFWPIAVISVLLLLLLMLIITSGCGGNTYTIKDGKGDPGALTVKEISAEELGVPVYPGAVLQSEGGMTEYNDKNDKEVMRAGILETRDPVSKVIDWYRTNLSGLPGFSEASTKVKGEDMGFFEFKSGEETKYVSVAFDDGYTEIAVTATTEVPGH